MKTFEKFDGIKVSPEVIRLKRKFGAAYGIVTGLAFAVASWGWNGYMLSQAHGYYPWVALIVGALACAVVGGVVGWLTAVSANSLVGVLLWVASSLFFAWLIVALPLQIAPYIVSKLDPQLGALMVYSEESVQFTSRFSVSLMWIVLFTLVVGAVQLPITEPAVFSVSVFGKITPFFFCILVMSISGAVTDSLINVYFRDAVFALNNTIQFVVDNKGNENVDLALSRQLHARAFGPVDEFVQESRSLYVGSYDNTLEDLQIMVKFDDQWVDCHVQSSQPIFCEMAVGK
jgi:hypothetical protein